MDRNDKAQEKIELFFDRALSTSEKVFKDAVQEIFSRVVDQTPTFFAHEPSSGNTKANWNASTGTPDASYSEAAADYTGEQTKNDIRSVVQNTVVTESTVFYLTNSSPSLPSLEFGLYPNPPFLGSWNTVTQQYEIRSSGGYSLQAPHGILGVTAMQWSGVVSDAIAKNMK